MRNPYARIRGPHFPPLDKVVQYEFEPGYVAFTMPCRKRIRVVLDGVTVADTCEGLTLFESDHTPVYYWPARDVRTDLLTKSDFDTTSPFLGRAEHFTLAAGSKSMPNAAWKYTDQVDGAPELSDCYSFYWNLVDHVYEEDEEVFVHVRDPYRRVDCLPSSRRVEVFLGGEKIADSTDAVFLFETGHTIRYYLPPEDVREDVLQQSLFESRCPYKGRANYYNVKIGDRVWENVAWFYSNAVEESRRVSGRICFWQEKVDKILVDGKPAIDANTPYSRSLYDFKQELPAARGKNYAKAKGGAPKRSTRPAAKQ